MQVADSSEETLRNLYRLAVLLTGDPGRADGALLASAAHCAAHLAQCRDRRQGLIYFIKFLRQECSDAVPRGGAAPGDFAGCFSALPEPGRTALALFYLNLLTIEEMAEVLEVEMEQLGELLGSARGLLGEADVAR